MSEKAVSVSTEKKYIPKKEFWMYGIAALGQGMIYASMSSYISDFYLNVMKLAPVFVLLLMLLARIWDAINDPLMGMVVDKFDSKYGKYKPYIIYTVIPIAVLTFFMFFVPKFTDSSSDGYNRTGTYVWVSFVYVLWGMIYTMSDVPFWSLPNAMTPEAGERGTTIGFARTMNGIGSVIPMAIFMGLGFLHLNDKTRYMVMAIVASVCGAMLFVSSYLTVKERMKLPKPVKIERKVSPLKLIFSDKALMMVVLMGIISSGRYMLQAAAVHVSRYTFYLQGMDIQSSQSTVQLIFSVCTAAGMFGAMLATPFFFKRFQYKTLVIFSCLVGGAVALVGYFIGILTNYNLYALIPCLIISCIPLGVINVVSYAMIGDCLDLMELKTGRRETALGNACQSFVNKLGNAFSTTMIIAMYMIVGLDINAMTAGGQSVEAIHPEQLSNTIRNGMYMLVTLIPAISLLLCCVPMIFYDITGRKKDQMLADLHKARIERGVNVDEQAA